MRSGETGSSTPRSAGRAGRRLRLAAGLAAGLASVLSPLLPTAPAAADPPALTGSIPAPCTSSWTNLGVYATCDEAGNLQLTDGGGYESSLSYYTTRISTTAPFTVQFDTDLVDQPKNAPYGADGIAVGLYDATNGAPTGPGDDGGGVGVAGLPVAAVDLKTYQDNPCDPTVPLVGITSGGVTSCGTVDNLTTSPQELGLANVNEPVSVTFDGAASSISVSLGGTEVLTGTISIPANAYLFISGATGEAADIQTVSSFSTDYTPPSVTATLTASSPTIQALRSVPDSALVTALTSSGGGTPQALSLGHVSLGHVSLGHVSLGHVSLGQVSLGHVSLGQVSLGHVSAATQALDDIAISDLPIQYPDGCTAAACTGWTGLLAGTSLAGSPLQSVTLGQVLADPSASARFNALPMGDVDFSNTVLASVPMSVIALAGTPLSDIPLPGAVSDSTSDVLQAWCNALTVLGYPGCFGIIPDQPTTAAGITPLTLDLAGVPVDSLELESTSLGHVSLGHVSLGHVSLGQVNLSASSLGQVSLGHVSLGHVALGGIPLDAILDLSAVVNCDTTTPDSVDCTSSTLTLADAQAAGAILPGATLNDLAAADLNSASLGHVSLGQVSLGHVSLGHVSLGQVDVASSSALGQVSLGQVDLGGIPLGQVPLDSIPDLSAVVNCAILDSGGTSFCSSTTDTLADAQAANAIISTATLSQLSDLDAASLGHVSLGQVDMATSSLGHVSLGQVDMAASSLGQVSLGQVDLGGMPLGQVPLDAIPDVGAVVNCDTSTPDSVDCTSSTLTLADAQTDDAVLSTATLGQLTDLDNTSLGHVSLGQVDLATSSLGHVSLGAIDDLGLVVDCSIDDPTSAVSFCDLPDDTLGQAAAGGALLPGATLADLGPFLATTLEQLGTYGGATLADLGPFLATTLAELGTYGRATLADLGPFFSTTVEQLLSQIDPDDPTFSELTLNNLLAGILPPSTYPWDTVDLSTLPLGQAAAPSGPIETFTTKVTVTNLTENVSAESITLPPGFTYVPGTTAVNGTTTEPDSFWSSITPATSTTSSTLTGPPVLITPGTYSVTVEAYPGLDIGVGRATASFVGTLSASASTDVTVTDPAADGNTPAAGPNGPLPLATDSLELGHIGAAGAVNYWSISVNQGDELALDLSNLPVDYDLALFSPDGTTSSAAGQLQGAPADQAPTVTDQAPSLGTTEEPLPGAGDVNQAAPPGYQTFAISDNRGTAEENIQTPPLDAGTYLVEVSGYNGASSDSPYLLRATDLPTNPNPSCPAMVSPATISQQTPGASDAVPANVNTLVLVNTEALTDDVGSAQEESAWNALGTLNGAGGVVSARIALDTDPSTAHDWATWAGGNPCSVGAANQVVKDVIGQVDALRAAHPSITSVVIVGGDDEIPFARVADGAAQANERDYASQTFPGVTNAESESLAEGYFLSDDPLTSSQPLGVGSATLYTPQLAVGRLITTPSTPGSSTGDTAEAIINAVQRFTSSGGVLSANSELTTGYSFLTSGAQVVSADLTQLTGNSVGDLINESWTHQDLDNALDTGASAPSIVSLNAHFDFGRALPAAGNASGDQTDLFTTADVRGASESFTGTLLFSMGCHSGLNLDDTEMASSGITSGIDDWAKTFADEGALWIGNTGYGYADTDTIAYSAKLMAGFAGQLGQSPTIGAAMTNAKQAYGAGDALLSPYDLKALMESTFYGLPMYKLSASGAAATTPPPATQTDPSTGLASASLTVAPVVSKVSPTGDPGTSYYQADSATITDSQGNSYTEQLGGETQSTEYRPIEPSVTVDVTQPSGQTAHGALITGLTSTDSPISPTVVQPDATDATTGTTPIAADEPFPNQIQRVSSSASLGAGVTTTDQDLDLVTGQFLPGSTAGQGTQRLFNPIQATVFYAPASNQDFTPATIVSDTATASGSTVNFRVVTEDPTTVDRVLVLYTDAASPGSWTPLDLGSSDGSTWTGAAPVTSSGQISYFVQVLDANGNVAVASNKGAGFPIVAAAVSSGNLSVSVPTAPPSGYFPGPVTVTISGGSGSGLMYSIDGGLSTPVPANGQVTVSGDGAHTIEATDDAHDSASAVVQIDATPPSVTASPVTGTTVAPGTTVDITATDAGSGVASITTSTSGAQSSVSPTITDASSTGVVLTTLGSTTITATATDNAGNVSSPQSFTYTVAKLTQTVAFTSSAPSPAYYGGSYTPSISTGTPGTAPTVSLDPLSSPVCVVSGSTVRFTGANGMCIIDAIRAASTIYNEAEATQAFLVDPAPLTVTAKASSMTYGGTLPALGASFTGLVNGDTPTSESAVTTCKSSKPAATAAGTYTGAITCTDTDPNYSPAYVAGTLTIGRAPLTVTAKPSSMTYGGTLPALGASFSGLVNGDTPTAESAVTTCKSSVAAGAAGGVYSGAITCTDSDPNYSPIYVAGTLTINATTTTLTYKGPSQVSIASSLIPTAALASPVAACASGQPVAFSLAVDPLNGTTPTTPYVLETVNSTATGAVNGTPVSTAAWESGVYAITANYAGTSSCGPSTAVASLAVTTPGQFAIGAGTYTPVASLGSTSFGFIVSRFPVSTTYPNQLTVITPGKWWFQANITSLGLTSTTQARLGGTGRLYWWNSTLNKGHGGWQLAASAVTFNATANAATKTKTKTTAASFGITINYTPSAGQPTPLPNSAPVALTSGSIAIL